MNSVTLQMSDFKPYRLHVHSVGAMVADKAFEFENELDGRHYSVSPSDIVLEGVAGEHWAIHQYEFLDYGDYRMDGKAPDMSRLDRGSSLEGTFTKVEVPDSPVIIWAAQVSVPDAEVTVPESPYKKTVNASIFEHGNGDFVCCANSYKGKPDLIKGCWCVNGLVFEKTYKPFMERALSVHEIAGALNSRPNDENTHGLGKIAKRIVSAFHKESDSEKRSRETDNLFRANDIYRQGQRDAEYKILQDLSRELVLTSRSLKEYEERTGRPIIPPEVVQEALKEKRENDERKLKNLETVLGKINLEIQSIRENGGIESSKLEVLSKEFDAAVKAIFGYQINKGERELVNLDFINRGTTNLNPTNFPLTNLDPIKFSPKLFDDDLER